MVACQVRSQSKRILRYQPLGVQSLPWYSVDNTSLLLLLLSIAAILIARSSPPWFIVDRPFLFCIRHNPTGAILFLGQVNKPWRTDKKKATQSQDDFVLKRDSLPHIFHSSVKYFYTLLSFCETGSWRQLSDASVSGQGCVRRKGRMAGMLYGRTKRRVSGCLDFFKLLISYLG